MTTPTGTWSDDVPVVWRIPGQNLECCIVRLDAGQARSDAPGMHIEDDGRYACPSCGEEVVVPVDPSAGEEQEYVEDCPVCCSPVLLHVRIAHDGEITVVARSE